VNAPCSLAVPRWLGEDAIKPWQYQSWIFVTDPNFAAKAARVLDLYNRVGDGKPLSANDYVVSADERPRSKPGAGATQRCRGKAQMVRVSHDYVRHGVTNLFAAFNVADGTVISSIHRRHRAVEFKKFQAKIDAEVPGDLDVHLVCDSYGTHKTPAINAWLAKHPRFHMHNTPTSSSWINQVERWFGFITDQLNRRGSHNCAQALEADIRAWATGWNQDPKPFIWTNPAEQILESIGRLPTRISGAGH
jgi:hypothetical protein